MRKGYSLIELLIVIVILPILFLVMSGFITTIFSDIPRSGKTIHDNSVMLIMLEQMEQDIDAAIDLPQSINGYTAGNELLLIEQADKVIHYQLKDNYVYRYGFSDNQQIPKDTRYWLLPEAKIKWQVHRQDGQNYAVEIQHHSEYILRGHLIKKMQNSHLFYPGIIE